MTHDTEALAQRAIEAEAVRAWIKYAEDQEAKAERAPDGSLTDYGHHQQKLASHVKALALACLAENERGKKLAEALRKSLEFHAGFPQHKRDVVCDYTYQANYYCYEIARQVLADYDDAKEGKG